MATLLFTKPKRSADDSFYEKADNFATSTNGEMEKLSSGSDAPVQSISEMLKEAQARKAMAGKSAVAGRLREQQQKGVVAYAPDNPQAVGDELRKRLGSTQGGQASTMPRFINKGQVETIQQRPTGGVIADYGGGNRVVTSKYGTGSVTAGPRKGNATIEGKNASMWFQEAANRQGQKVLIGSASDGPFFKPKGQPSPEFIERKRTQNHLRA